jgi:hypothetical protein
MKTLMTIFAALCVAVQAAGCSMGSYATVDVPFCVSDEPGKSSMPEKSLTLLRKHWGGWSMEPLSQGFGGPHTLGMIGAKKTILAVVACDGKRDHVLNAGEFMKEFSETHVPPLCDGQEVLVHMVLKAEKDARAEALGHDGVYHFPKIDLGCVDGRTVQDNLRTLGQILGDFVMSVQAFMEKQGRPPAGLAELVEVTLAHPLPPDPWGAALKFQVTGKEVRLLSSGPDRKDGTDDDEVVCSVKKGQSTHILVFKGSDMDYDDDYRAYLKKQGF